jgi:hypothetical protein
MRRTAESKANEGTRRSKMNPMFRNFKFFNFSTVEDQRKLINTVFKFFMGMIVLKMLFGGRRGDPSYGQQMQGYNPIDPH